MIDNAVPFVHNALRGLITRNDITIDATCGNGNDTLFLASLSKHVYAFDIQKNAIQNTKQLLEKNQLQNVTLFQVSHTRISDFITNEIKAIIFNLGYLPNGDKSVITNAKSTLKAISSSLPLLVKNGIIAIVLYVGHVGGQEEANTIEAFAKNLPGKTYKVIKYDFLNKHNPPYVIMIQKL